MERRVGVDVGGTFTDVVTVADGEISVRKVPSTPDQPAEGVFDGLAPVIDRRIDFLGHGTTVATNAVLERDWAETALITTEGFRDVLEIGRGDRPSLYDLQAEKPEPVVPRHRRHPVEERMDPRGDVDTPLDASAIDSVVDELDTQAIESVAIALLFAFENPAHENQLAEALADADPDLSISRSSRVLPEIREYERTLATAMNAALKPVMERYLGRLETDLAERDVATPLRLMQSNGGIIPARAAGQRPINTLLSGPAAGVEGAAHLGRLAGHDDVITMDMGGTSCDVSLVREGEPVTTTEGSVGEYPIGVPMVDVHTIGAGGGSIAWIDDGGALRVGPRSAGAEPGPVCYGRGGERPTVTDAHAVLGRIDPQVLLPDSLDADVSGAQAAIDEHIAEPLELSTVEAAAGILRVANANMERALRVVSVERGHDPRSFALVAFGGAGPLHGGRLCHRLDMPRVLVPRPAGVLSALGLTLADLVSDFSTSRVRPWAEVDPDELSETFSSFEKEGRDDLVSAGIDLENIELERTVDMRYRGQSFTISISIEEKLDDAGKHAVADRFHDRHASRYGHAAREEPLELVTVRLRARGEVEPPSLGRVDADRDPAPRKRDVWFPGGMRETTVRRRERLEEADVLEGPMVIEGTESTVLVHPGQTAWVDPHGTLVIEADEGARR